MQNSATALDERLPLIDRQDRALMRLNATAMAVATQLEAHRNHNGVHLPPVVRDELERFTRERAEYLRLADTAVEEAGR
jgi:hypothetical protein